MTPLTHENMTPSRTPSSEGDLLQWRNDLVDILNSIPTLSFKTAKTPIIDSSNDTSDLHSTAETITGLRAFESTVAKEIEALDKTLDDPKLGQSQTSTNALYFKSVWKEIQAASSLVAVGRKYNIPTSPSGKASPNPGKRRSLASKPPKQEVKVDVVADEGRTWIRVNNIKNSRIRSEFNDIDAYAHEEFDSDESEDPTEALPSGGALVPPSPLDNSVLRMGRSLLQAARSNPVSGLSLIPRVHLRLTRLDPAEQDPLRGTDPRIQQTIDELESMGITVLLGERDDSVTTSLAHLSMGENGAQLHDEDTEVSETLHVTHRINLDLSLLVAMVSDITHAPLTVDEQASLQRYRPLIRTWKKPIVPISYGDDGKVVGKTNPHLRALSNQAEQERRLGLFDEMHNRMLTALPHKPSSITSTTPSELRCEYWTTPEAKSRLSGIIAKIGGPSERRRAQALFADVVESDDAEERFWRGSRFPCGHIKGLVPVRVYPSEEPDVHDDLVISPFHGLLAQACRSVLADFANSPSALPEAVEGTHVPVKAAMKSRQTPNSALDKTGSTKVRAASLTPHTVRSMLWGASNGITTLTANRASVKAILREMKSYQGSSLAGGLGAKGDAPQQGEATLTMVQENNFLDSVCAALWIVEPRSLAENMRTDLAVAT